MISSALNFFLLSTFSLALNFSLFMRRGDQIGLVAQVVIHKFHNTQDTTVQIKGAQRCSSLRKRIGRVRTVLCWPRPDPAPGPASAAGFRCPACRSSGRATPQASARQLGRRLPLPTPYPELTASPAAGSSSILRRLHRPGARLSMRLRVPPLRPPEGGNTRPRVWRSQ